jgi:type IV pilus assembly protein PilA
MPERTLNPRAAADRRRGFTLIELMIVVAVIAAIASIAIPKLLAARMSANEAAAIATLRSLSSSQAQVRASNSIDTDSDGAGEYGYFGELAGTVPLRVNSGGGVPGPGLVNIDELQPPVLAASFGVVDANGLTARSGYFFRIFLPGPTAGGLTPGVQENAGGGAQPGNFPHPNNAENLWSCYAWPVNAGESGNRAFYTDHSGSMLQFVNRSATPYDGTVKVPNFDEALTVVGDMASQPRIGVAGGADNTTWTPVQ